MPTLTVTLPDGVNLLVLALDPTTDGHPLPTGQPRPVVLAVATDPAFWPRDTLLANALASLRAAVARDDAAATAAARAAFDVLLDELVERVETCLAAQDAGAPVAREQVVRLVRLAGNLLQV